MSRSLRLNLVLAKIDVMRVFDVPWNLVVSIPPRVSSAFPTDLEVKNKLNRDGSPWDSSPAKKPWATDDIPIRKR